MNGTFVVTVRPRPGRCPADWYCNAMRLGPHIGPRCAYCQAIEDMLCAISQLDRGPLKEHLQSKS